MLKLESSPVSPKGREYALKAQAMVRSELHSVMIVHAVDVSNTAETQERRSVDVTGRSQYPVYGVQSPSVLDSSYSVDACSATALAPPDSPVTRLDKRQIEALRQGSDEPHHTKVPKVPRSGSHG